MMGSEAWFVRNSAVQLIKNLIVRAELNFRSALRTIADRRLDRLYGNLPAQALASRKDAEHQAKTLAGIVEAHCAAGADISNTHRTAGLQLDAAEYALSMMIVELRDVMVAPGLSSTPEKRATVPQFIRVADTVAQAA